MSNSKQKVPGAAEGDRRGRHAAGLEGRLPCQRRRWPEDIENKILHEVTVPTAGVNGQTGATEFLHTP